MLHYTYKISTSDRYYVGRHSTNNLDDGYIGSGKWVRSLKDKNNLKKEILQFFDSYESLLIGESLLIESVINDERNMNFNNNPVGFAGGNLNPACSENEKRRRSDYNWMKTEEGRTYFSENNPSKKDSVKILRKQACSEQLEKNEHNFQREDVRAKVAEISKERFTNDNPSKKEENKKKIKERCKDLAKQGKHNFQDPILRLKMNALAKERFLLNNPMKDENVSSLFKKPKEKVACPHCCKIGGKPVMMRYHFDNCKTFKK